MAVNEGDEIYVIVDSHIEGGEPKCVVHGVYSNRTLANTAAFHPYLPLKVLTLNLDSEPVAEAVESCDILEERSE